MTLKTAKYYCQKMINMLILNSYISYLDGLKVIKIKKTKKVLKI